MQVESCGVATSRNSNNLFKRLQTPEPTVFCESSHPCDVMNPVTSGNQQSCNPIYPEECTKPYEVILANAVICVNTPVNPVIPVNPVMHIQLSL